MEPVIPFPEKFSNENVPFIENLSKWVIVLASAPADHEDSAMWMSLNPPDSYVPDRRAVDTVMLSILIPAVFLDEYQRFECMALSYSRAYESKPQHRSNGVKTNILAIFFILLSFVVRERLAVPLVKIL